MFFFFTFHLYYISFIISSWYFASGSGKTSLLYTEIKMSLPFLWQFSLRQHFCHHPTSRQCPSFRMVSLYSSPLTALLSFLPKGSACNCFTCYTCGESNVACHRFSSQPLKKNLKMFSKVAKYHIKQQKQQQQSLFVLLPQMKLIN